MGYAKVAPIIASVIAVTISVFLYHRIRRELVILGSLAVFIVANLMEPIFQNFVSFILFNALATAVFVVVDLGLNVWSFKLFKDRNAVPLQIMNLCLQWFRRHFGFRRLNRIHGS